MSTYAYLISDGKQVSISTEKPLSVQFVHGGWSELRTSLIGECITIYTDDIWVGTLGVYDISIPEQAMKLARDTRLHTLALAERRIEHDVMRIVGDDARREVEHYMWTMSEDEREKYEWTPLGGLLWRIMRSMKTICFQNQ